MQLDWLQSHQELALALVLVCAFAEACIGIGLFVSGFFLVTLSAWLYTSGAYDLYQILPLACIGAVLGDHAGFHAGYHYGPRLHKLNFVQARRQAVLRAETLIRNYGAIAVFIGRFVPAIRSLIPALLGTSGFRPVYFSILDIVACLLWTLGLGLIVQGVDNLL